MSESRTCRVLGVGGIFLRSTDPARLGEWNAEQLGFSDESWGDTRGTSIRPADLPAAAITGGARSLRTACLETPRSPT
jgi:hypothetical protein